MEKMRKSILNLTIFVLTFFMVAQVLTINTNAVSSTKASAATAVVQSSAEDTNKPKTILPGIIYDKDKKILYGPRDKGLLLLGFDYDMNQNLWYSALDPWQRAFGYNLAFDVIAPATSIYFKTRTIFFDYDGLVWMLKLWKGQYGVTSGAEVGLYHRKPDVKYFYQCASKENFLLMDLEVLRFGRTYFKREAQKHWWQTGFIVGGLITLNSLELKSNITFKDKKMRDSFVKAFSTQDNLADVKYKVKGLSVSLDWKT